MSALLTITKKQCTAKAVTKNSMTRAVADAVSTAPANAKVKAASCSDLVIAFTLGMGVTVQYSVGGFMYEKSLQMAETQVF